MKDGVGDEVLILLRNSREWALGCPGDGGKGQVCGIGAVLFAPLIKQAPVAQRDVICRSDTEPRRGPVNPFGGALKLRIVADGGFVHHAMPLAVMPLRAPFLIAEGSDQSERQEDFLECRTVSDLGFGLHAVLVPVFANAVVRHTLVSCLLYTSPSPRDRQKSRMPSSA